MTLPYDIARCPGTTHPTCWYCRRKEPGRSDWQSYIVPPIDMATGECGSHIDRDYLARLEEKRDQLADEYRVGFDAPPE